MGPSQCDLLVISLSILVYSTIVATTTISSQDRKKMSGGYPIFELRSFKGAYLDPIGKGFQETFEFLKYLNKHGRYS